MQEKFRKELQERVYGIVSINHDSFRCGCEIRIDTPNLSYTQFVDDKDISCEEKIKPLLEQVIINYEIKVLSHFIKGKGI